MNEGRRGRLIKAFFDVRRCLQQAAGQGDLTQGEFLVLRRIKVERAVAGMFGLFKAAHISQYLSMPPPALSRIFNSLEGRGLIERSINRENRRSVVISLTMKGEAVLADAEARVGAFIDRLTASLGDEDTDRLLELLERVTEFFAEEELP